MLQHRDDIDGLRTIAVALVIFNHAGFELFSGGFVGVDVFFVISGFLITAIIAPKIAQKQFSFAWFFSRRIKRLMPILLFVLLVTGVVFSLFLLPSDLVRFYESALWVILYGGNIFFWLNYGGYFAGDAQAAPLLHTWSLAVEEQYYMVWPVLLVIAIRLFGSRWTRHLTLFGCIAAVLFSQWATETTIGAAYYLLPTRFFELMVGSCLALYWQHLPAPSKYVQHLLSASGLMLILGSAVMLTKYSPFPGYNALYPVLGTALIIYARGGWVNQLLAARPIVYTGNISYSLYLWHWPIFVAIHYLAIEMALAVQLGAIALTYLLSVLSYHYLEQPLRHAPITTFRPIATRYYLLPSLGLAAIMLVGIYQQGYPQRYSPELAKMEQALNSFANESRKGCHSPSRDHQLPPNETCVFGAEDTANAPKLLLIGDSHANHFVPFVQALAEHAQVVAQDYTMDQCIPFTQLYWGPNRVKAERCQQRNQLVAEHIQTNQFDYVVLAGSWPNHRSNRIYHDGESVDDIQQKQAQLYQAASHTLALIAQSGAVPIVLEDTPILGGKGPDCPVKQTLFNPELNCRVKRNNNPFFEQLVNQLKQHYPELRYLRTQDLFCDTQRCDMVLDGIPLYRDDDHLNEIGAALLGQHYLKQHANPFIRHAKNQFSPHVSPVEPTS